MSHVHVIAETSFVLEGGLREAFFADSVRNGFISVDVWQPLLVSGVQIHYHSQLLAYHDCIYRFASQYEYMLFADQDDFFYPWPLTVLPPWDIMLMCGVTGGRVPLTGLRCILIVG